MSEHRSRLSRLRLYHNYIAFLIDKELQTKESNERTTPRRRRAVRTAKAVHGTTVRQVHAKVPGWPSSLAVGSNAEVYDCGCVGTKGYRCPVHDAP